jgi:hypothetical protein
MESDRGIHWLRAALAALLLWWTVRLGSGASTWCFMDFVNLAFHEFGHLLFRPFGTTLHYLGGTLFQLFVPAMLVVYFVVRRNEPSGSAFCFWWIGQNLINVSIYMADARELNLPLVGGGDHDWNELFYRFGLLSEESVARVAGLTHGLGVVVMILGLAWWFYFVLPSAARSRVNEAITGRSPALELLFPVDDG